MSIFSTRTRRRHLAYAVAAFESEQGEFSVEEMAQADALLAGHGQRRTNSPRQGR